MANLLDNLLGKDNPVKKLQKEIEGMELRKQSLVSAIQNEIRAARQKIDDELRQIGLKVYTSHKNNEPIDLDQIANFGEIENLNNLVAEKEAKKNEIEKRYDEEIGMMRAHLSTLTPNANDQRQQNLSSGVGGARVACPNCNAPYTPGVDLFCTGCGKSLDNPATTTDGAKALCGGCGKPYTPGKDLFCMGCGQKLN